MLVRLLKAWLPVAAMCAIIFAFSQDPHTGHNADVILGWLLGLFHADTVHNVRLLDFPFLKLGHVTVYFLLGALAYRAFALGRTRFDFPAAIRTIIFTAAYAWTDEFHQSFVPGRDGMSLGDITLDTVAGLLALVIIWLWYRRHSSLPLPATAAGPPALVPSEQIRTGRSSPGRGL